MWKVLGYRLLASAASMIFTKEVFEEVKDVVKAATRLDMSGAEKKEHVKKELNDVRVMFNIKFGDFVDIALDSVIQVALVVVTGLKEKLPK